MISHQLPATSHTITNTPVNVGQLGREFERIKSVAKESFEWLYGTEHYEPAVGIYDAENFDVVDRLKKWSHRFCASERCLIPKSAVGSSSQGRRLRRGLVTQ